MAEDFPHITMQRIETFQYSFSDYAGVSVLWPKPRQGVPRKLRSCYHHKLYTDFRQQIGSALNAELHLVLL